MVLPRARAGLYRLTMPNALNFAFDYAYFVQARVVGFAGCLALALVLLQWSVKGGTADTDVLLFPAPSDGRRLCWSCTFRCSLCSTGTCLAKGRRSLAGLLLRRSAPLLLRRRRKFDDHAASCRRRP